MKHLSLSRLVVLTGLSLVALSASAQNTKKIIMKCYDTFGTFLLTDSIVQPQEDCFFLIPPKIPYYTCKTYDPNGSSACLVGGELNVHYAANGFTGFDSLTQQALELEEQMSFVMTEAHDGETWLWTAKNEQTVTLIPMKEATHTPDETWVLKKDFTGWLLYNEAKGLFVTAISPKGELLLSENPEALGLKASKVQGEAWEITDLQSQRTHRFVPLHYSVLSFFQLTENFVNDKGEEIAPPRNILVKAGAPIIPKAQNITNYQFTLQKLDDEELDKTAVLPTMTQHHTIDYIYKKVTAILQQRTATQQSVPTDLSGRLVDGNYRGLVIINGRVSWQ